mmetsp:Transcript_10735/g.16330  ORF Transcript_10735/g.16330 Transcript_10735/m.16330 type:complete len:220 (-) Transcript_10735:5087-5746(-)|eukprot:CAMPEP_0170513382 /NCGR_PEP_ID=MMETSP0208-20121228/67366_1 /TAXON_ID=197538 /ORGANISM="Strombidium inclinatum, Strain S3" /LENGTH=219 /DNA_ID=CAMNT_0010797107 /DNA_START=6891 /DNA_END=7550 /DNA_ORIENTATION=-
MKTISFESQLLLANNLEKQITLVFEIRKLNASAVDLKPKYLQNHPTNFDLSGSRFAKLALIKPRAKTVAPRKVVSFKKLSDQEVRDPKCSLRRSKTLNPQGEEAEDFSLKGSVPIKKKRNSDNSINITESNEEPDGFKLNPEAVIDVKAKSEDEDDDQSVDLEEEEEKEQWNEDIHKNTFRISLPPQEVFRVPLVWMMPDSEVDIRIMKKTKEDEDDYD